MPFCARPSSRGRTRAYLIDRRDIGKGAALQETALVLCCRSGWVAGVEHLLDVAGAGVDVPVLEGRTPLYVAAAEGNENCVALLLSHGAQVNLCKDDGTSPLAIAALNRHLAVVNILVKNGADVNLGDVDGFTPLFAVAQNGLKNFVSLLLERGAQVNLANRRGITPLYIAAGKFQIGKYKTPFLLHRVGGARGCA